MKSIKKTMTKAASKAMAGVGMTSGVAAAPADARAGWEDFSDFSNAVPIGGGASLVPRAVPLHDGLGAETEPHPLTKQWAARIKNPKTRAAFVKRPLESYADAHPLHVWTGTWNTNGKPPPDSLDISAWLDVASSPDLVVVGFQEIVPLTPGKVLMQEDAQATGQWETIIERCLNGAERDEKSPALPAPASAADGWTAFGDDAASRRVTPRANGAPSSEPTSTPYVRVARKQLVGVYITVWATRAVSCHVSDVRTAAVATGVNLGVAMLGNKGGAAVWLKVHNTPLCFVCAHLSAGSKENDAQKRSEDYREIYAKLAFPPPAAASSDGVVEKPAGVADAFAAVWIGDLNYRLNLADDLVRSSLAAVTTWTENDEDFRVRSAYAAERARQYASLLGADQLSLERAAGKAFVGWTEAPVAFAPTYKYRPGTHTFSGAGDADEPNGDETPAASAKEERKKRTPAWCDRVLWRGRDVSQLSYGSTRALTQSDHKPVFSAFTVTTQRLCPTKLSAVLNETRRDLDAAEMASQPRCTVLNPRAVFDDVLSFAEPRATSFRLVNTGDAPASWNFVAAVPGEEEVAPPWLRVAPVRGTLLPGEEAVITATATIVGGGGAGPAALASAAGLGVGADADADADATRTPREPVSAAAESFPSADSSSDPRADPAAGALAPTATTAGSIAEAARLAQARAVSAGIVRIEAGGGVSMVSSGSGRAANASANSPFGSRRGSAMELDLLGEPIAAAAAEEGCSPRSHAQRDASSAGLHALMSESDGDEAPRDRGDFPVDAILVLHLDGGRDFFLTVAGTVRGSVFGKPLWHLPTASFPPGVPAPIGALVDVLFAVPAARTLDLFRSPSRGTLAGLAAVRRALDADAADPTSATLETLDAAEAAHALLALFAALPRPLFATTQACLAAVDGVMAPWAQAAAQVAGAAAATGAPWTLATERLTRLVPAAVAAEALLAAHLRPAERAAALHTVSFLRGMFQFWYGGGGAADANGRGAPSSGREVARVVSQFAEVWFPPPAAGSPGAAAKRMGRLAFVGALSGAAPSALDGFNPMDVLFDVTLGTGTGTGTGTGMETVPNGASCAPPGMAARAPAETPVPAGLAGVGMGGPGLTGNLIDF